MCFTEISGAVDVEDVSSLRPCICQQLLCLATKDHSDRLLAAGDPKVKACELYQNFLPFALLP
jgi:hypothetical protein